jgi:hypothetical protein
MYGEQGEEIDGRQRPHKPKFLFWELWLNVSVAVHSLQCLSDRRTGLSSAIFGRCSGTIILSLGQHVGSSSAGCFHLTTCQIPNHALICINIVDGSLIQVAFFLVGVARPRLSCISEALWLSSGASAD